MSPGRVLSSARAQLFLPVLLGVSLPVLAQAAPAAESLLEIVTGPRDTKWLRLAELQVLLDGSPLPVTLPPADAGPDQLVHSSSVSPGGHQLDVVAGFTGDSTAFSYVKGYVFRMRSQLQLDASAGEVVSVQIRATERTGLTVEWTNRFRLALRTTHRPLDREALARASAVAADAPAVPTAPADGAARPSPATLAQRLPPPSCALETPRFRRARYDLDEAGRAALDRFAACLSASADAVLIEGFADPTGPAEFNKWLSERRAQAVAGYLVQRGVARSRFTIRSFGATRFVCTEASAICYSRNRRVEAVASST
jgi:outer membrane protein OmpA-like peptidoglycan-associated protein